ncbi:MAG: hypothetical protein R3E64_09375 [Halioglobus sp.]
MKQTLRTLFAPLLNLFEGGEDPFVYKKSHRTILIVVSGLFLVLATAVVVVGVMAGKMAAVFPGFIFFLVALTCLVVGSLGTDRAVAKIWGGK